MPNKDLMAAFERMNLSKNNYADFKIQENIVKFEKIPYGSKNFVPNKVANEKFRMI